MEKILHTLYFCDTLNLFTERKLKCQKATSYLFSLFYKSAMFCFHCECTPIKVDFLQWCITNKTINDESVLSWFCWYKETFKVMTRTHTQTITSSITSLTAQLVFYLNKIQWTKHRRTCLLSPLERDWSTKPIIYIMNNNFAFRYIANTEIL